MLESYVRSVNRRPETRRVFSEARRFVYSEYREECAEWLIGEAFRPAVPRTPKEDGKKEIGAELEPGVVAWRSQGVRH